MEEVERDREREERRMWRPMVLDHSLTIYASVFFCGPCLTPGDQPTVQDRPLPTVHGRQRLSIWGELQFCSWTWRGWISSHTHVRFPAYVENLISQVRNVQMNLAALNPNYKGSLCKYFMTTGECEFGSICQYAHGNMVRFSCHLCFSETHFSGTEEEPVHGCDARNGWYGGWQPKLQVSLVL